MNNAMRYAMVGFVMVAGLLAGRSEASVVIGGTRVVYPAQDREVTVKISNEGKTPSLVQVWLDDGDVNSTPDKAKVPFTVTPPIFRVDPDKAQTIRLSYTQEPLAKDKETLFWINVLEVPPKAANADGRNMLQFAFRTRIKLFFRPDGLAGDAKSAQDKLTWKLVAGEGGKGWALQADNPTPYYVSVASAAIHVDGRSIENAEGGTVAPMSSTTIALDGLNTRPTGDVQVQYKAINDYGAVGSFTKSLTP
ncbi:fimbrial biogenesis chaperone [Dyella sp.]|uniref:fimbrial biogenesis chaperone n=1 Tax=Dyella sp. TaxID=1869338 RepID=UPI002ED2350B